MMLDWPDCSNARDPGGLPTAGGGRIRAGALLRSDDHHRMTPATVAAVRASGVSRIVDLRWAWECLCSPSPFARDAVYRHVPLLSDPLGYRPPPDSYRPMLDHNRFRFAAACRAVAEAPAGTVVVHCTSGRDRTGVLVALLLMLAGAAAGDVAAEYARTEGSSAAIMATTLAHLEQRHGGAASYLTTAGMEPAELAALRDRLLT